MFNEIDKGKYWDRAWSLVEGCTPISEGCAHCWSAAQTHMRKGQANAKIKARYRGLTTSAGCFNGKIRLMSQNLELPLRTRKPTAWALWNDLFHKNVSERFIVDAWDTMLKCPQHIFLVLTKRVERMQKLVGRAAPNIYLGVTAENQEQADKRIPILLQIPGKKWLSLEPMLGPISLIKHEDAIAHYEKKHNQRLAHVSLIHWVICGGETGHGARPMHPDWPRRVRDQCKEAGVPYFHKQNGMWIPVDTVGDDPDPQGRSAMAYKDGTVDLNWQPGPKCIGAQPMWRVTKKEQAGRLLDGQTWSQLPLDK